MPEFALVFPTGDLIRRNATTKYDQFKVFFNTETATIRENGDRLGSIQSFWFSVFWSIDWQAYTIDNWASFWYSNLRIRLPGIIPPGRYNVAVGNMNNFPIPISISISTFGRTRDQYPIELRSYVVQPKDKKELYIYAEITNGEYPVQNAYIWCEIYRNEWSYTYGLYDIGDKAMSHSL